MCRRYKAQLLDVRIHLSDRNSILENFEKFRLFQIFLNFIIDLVYNLPLKSDLICNCKRGNYFYNFIGCIFKFYIFSFYNSNKYPIKIKLNVSCWNDQLKRKKKKLSIWQRYVVTEFATFMKFSHYYARPYVYLYLYIYMNFLFLNCTKFSLKNVSI